jgi:peptidoglycan-N-acetylglucosamine deacetylase
MKPKIAYLTIDDAPSTTMKWKVDYLFQKGIPAVWFCQGNYLEQRPDFALHAIQKGFLIGNHSYNHAHFSDLSLSQCFEQIERTDGLLAEVYKKARIEKFSRFFRFPYGDKGGETSDGSGSDSSERQKKTAIQSFLREMGYVSAPSRGIVYKYYTDKGLDKDIDWYWTYDVMDWSIKAAKPRSEVDSIEKVLQRMDEDEPENGKGLNYRGSVEIVLLHDHAEISEYFERIICCLVAKGLSFELPGSV